MADLEQALRDLGERLDYPAAPNLAAGVRLRLTEPAAARRRVPAIPAARRRLLLSSATAFVVLVMSVLGFWAPAREAVADLFGLRGVRFSREPSPVRPGESVRLGKPVDLDGARRAVDFELRIPTRLGMPDAAYVDEAAPENVVSLVYRPGPDRPEVGSTGVGVLVSQFRGRIDAAVMTKFLGPGSTIEPISVDGRRGFWLPEPGHVVMYLDRQGRVQEDTARLTANVLLFERDGVIIRVESRLSRDEMQSIAASAN
ncbi:MAG TPA: hypothetical protein VG795_12125 [Acidimicrobiia bacterium]|nr:hypothetical protein [Acidimicrobiia bacterium]